MLVAQRRITVASASRQRRTSAVAAAAAQPCVVIVPPPPSAGNSAPDAAETATLLAERVQATTGLPALVIAPAAATTAAGALTTGAKLRLRRDAALGALGFRLLDGGADGTTGGATGADAVFCATDPKAGLARALGLAPALVLAAVHRGPALSAGAESVEAVAVARTAALLGLPAIAACLASPSPGAPIAGAVEAAATLAGAALVALRRAEAFPAANHPRAHFPMPTRGRWALGRELPLPRSATADAAAAAGALAGQGCWALGEDGSWLGGGGVAAAAAPLSRGEAARLLRAAFAEGDLLLLLNVPPTWAGARSEASGSSSQTKPFAATRPGVLWPCPQLEADFGDGGGGGGRSWAVDAGDLFGRSLPRQGYGGAAGETGAGAGAGAQTLTAGAFVAQDNTAATAARLRQQGGSSGGGDGGGGQAAVAAAAVPAAAAALEAVEFVIARGTTLADDCSCGDVEAVMARRASVTALPTWPAAHPFAPRDELLLRALEEDAATGLPAWLCCDDEAGC